LKIKSHTGGALELKIFISADMEGISGIFSMAQTDPHEREYERARKLMTEEINSVIEAAFRFGADKIVVNDSHGGMDNILREDLDRRAVLISGNPKPLSMMQGIDSSFDAVFFVGYHARAGFSEAVIDHTYTLRVLDVKINGKSVGEAGINGRLAGYFGVPVVFISGDQNAVSCAYSELENPVGVVVKEAVGRTSAKLFPFEMVKERLTAGVSKALESIRTIKPTIEKPPIELEISFTVSNMADICLLIPGAVKKAPRTVIYKGKDYLETFNVFRVMLMLTSGIR
jgi:D-amino peptidase